MYLRRDRASGGLLPADHDMLMPLREVGAFGQTTKRDRLSGSSPVSFQGIVNSITDGVIVAGVDGHFLLFNPAAERILGVGPTDVPPSEWTATYGCFLADTVTPFPQDELPLVRAIRGETVYDCQMYIRNAKTPRGVWLSLDCSPIRDAAGAVIGGIVVFRDVTAARQLLEREQLHSAVVEQTADSVIITDRDGVIEYANPAAATMSGFSVRELTGRTPRLFRSGAHDAEFYAKLWSTLLDGRVYRERSSTGGRTARSTTPSKRSRRSGMRAAESSASCRSRRTSPSCGRPWSGTAVSSWRSPCSNGCIRRSRSRPAGSILPAAPSWLTKRAGTTSTSSRGRERV